MDKTKELTKELIDKLRTTTEDYYKNPLYLNGRGEFVDAARCTVSPYSVLKQVEKMMRLLQDSLNTVCYLDSEITRAQLTKGDDVKVKR